MFVFSLNYFYLFGNVVGTQGMWQMFSRIASLKFHCQHALPASVWELPRSKGPLRIQFIHAIAVLLDILTMGLEMAVTFLGGILELLSNARTKPLASGGSTEQIKSTTVFIWPEGFQFSPYHCKRQTLTWIRSEISLLKSRGHRLQNGGRWREMFLQSSSGKVWFVGGSGPS